MEENKPLQEKPKAKRKKPTPKVSLPTITVNESNLCTQMSEVTLPIRKKKSVKKNMPIPHKPQAFNYLYLFVTIQQQIKLLKLKFKTLHQHFKLCVMFNKESLTSIIRIINNKPL
jgi:hypothetical protein